MPARFAQLEPIKLTVLEGVKFVQTAIINLQKEQLHAIRALMEIYATLGMLCFRLKDHLQIMASASYVHLEDIMIETIRLLIYVQDHPLDISSLLPEFRI